MGERTEPFRADWEFIRITAHLLAADSAEDGKGVGETEMFAFRCFRNGNLHLRFKRLDLLKRLNEIAGGQNFRSSESSGSGLAVI